MPIYNHDNKHTINEKDVVQNSFYLHSITYEELKVAMKGLSNSGAVGSGGLKSIIIKDNFILISNQMLFIFNLSFVQGVFTKLLKTAIVTLIYKSGSYNDPIYYRPISILTIFSKLNCSTIGYYFLLILKTYFTIINLDSELIDLQHVQLHMFYPT